MKEIMFRLILSAIIVMTVSFISSAQTNKKETCKSEHSNFITLSQLQSRWPHYKFKTLDDALDDLKREMRKSGVVRVVLKSRNESHKGPAYAESYHYSTNMYDSRGRSLVATESLFSIQVCIETSSGPQLEWRYGWK